MDERPPFELGDEPLEQRRRGLAAEPTPAALEDG
jgi:hypothetical protein